MTANLPGRRRVAALVAFSPFALAACSRGSAEARLRARIVAMQEALEARKTAAFMAGVSPDFIGPGGLDHAGVRNLLRLQFLRHAKVGATLGPLAIEMRSGGADVTFKVISTGGDGSFLPDTAHAWSVRSAWRDGADGWQVVQADWAPAL
ncbi:MAG: nuclear transport factor 2 family protein [Burkholderiaceae bacterium]|nr:MAG: nuclear transport factor 2 family protein [Burkholderiaceae bacterium]